MASFGRRGLALVLLFATTACSGESSAHRNSPASSRTPVGAPPTAASLVDPSNAKLLPLALGDKSLYPVALTADGSMVADVMKGAAHFGVALVDLASGHVRTIAAATARNDAALNASGDARWIVWSMSADTSLDVPNWRLYAYDRHAGRIVTIVTNRNSNERVAPVPVLTAHSVIWSTNTPDGHTLAIYRADLEPNTAPDLAVRDATSPYVYGGRVYMLQRKGDGNILVSARQDALRSASPVSGVEQVRQYVVLREGVVYLSRSDPNAVLFSATGSRSSQPVSYDPGLGSAEGLTAGDAVVGVNHEDVGVLDYIGEGKAIVVSNQEAANHVLVAGCYALWQESSQQKAVARWFRLC